MGPLPAEPVVGYLARSLSLFYALIGGMLVFCSFDLHRYRALLYYLGISFTFFGMVVFGIDYVEGMPLYWKIVEGPYVTAFGIVILALLIRCRRNIK